MNETVCVRCGSAIFQRPDDAWDLVYREQCDTKVCIAEEDLSAGAVLGRSHTPVTA